MTADLSYLRCSVVVREGCSSVGVDVQTTHGAPAGERFRVDYGANHNVTIALELAFSFARDLLPSLIGFGQFGRIFHDFENCSVVGFVEPSHSDDLDMGGSHA